MIRLMPKEKQKSIAILIWNISRWNNWTTSNLKVDITFEGFFKPQKLRRFVVCSMLKYMKIITCNLNNAGLIKSFKQKRKKPSYKICTIHHFLYKTIFFIRILIIRITSSKRRFKVNLLRIMHAHPRLKIFVIDRI